MTRTNTRLRATTLARILPILFCVPTGAAATDAMTKMEQKLLDRLQARASTAQSTTASTARGVSPITVGSNCAQTDLQQAIDNISDGGEIRLVNETFTGNFVVSDKSLTLSGGYETCSASEPTFSSSLDADGSGTVLELTDPIDNGVHEIRLENLTIRDGNQTVRDAGGGIHIDGEAFDVELVDVNVIGNQTVGRGGGIQAAGSTGPALTTSGDTILQGNSAEEGGGLACVGPAGTPGVNQPLVIIDTGLVLNNEAIRGGGIYSSNCIVLVYAGGFLQGVASNRAVSGPGADTGQGGGIFAELESGIGLYGAPGVLADGSPDAPASLVGNSADSLGGGALISGGASLTATDADIAGNTAGNNGGGVVVADADLTIERADGTTCETEQCPRLRDNSSITGGGVVVDNPGDGTRGVSGTASRVTITQTFVDGNRATGDSGTPADDGNGAVVFILNGSAYLEGNVIHGNDGRSLVRQQPDTTLGVAWSTVADNTIDPGGRLFHARGSSSGTTRTRLLSSILRDDSAETLLRDSSAGSGFDFTGDCLITSELASIPDATASAVLDPLFVDPAGNDYHIQHLSPAVDWCDGSNTPTQRDMDDQSRGVNVVAGAPAYDAGADEQQGVIFSDGFEST